MQKFLLFSMFSFLLLFGITYAHPGNVSYDGCHYCWTNCTKRGYTYGTRHCHNGGIPKFGTADPLYYSNSKTTISYKKSCSELYGIGAIDDGKGGCKCKSNYIADGNKCVWADTYCQNSLGIFSKYNSFSQQCECNYGYGYYNGKCTSLNSICQGYYGWNASYDSLNKSCKCSYGYEVYNGKCTNLNSICSKKYGYSYHYDSFKKSCTTY